MHFSEILSNKWLFWKSIISTQRASWYVLFIYTQFYLPSHILPTTVHITKPGNSTALCSIPKKCYRLKVFTPYTFSWPLFCSKCCQAAQSMVRISGNRTRNSCSLFKAHYKSHQPCFLLLASCISLSSSDPLSNPKYSVTSFCSDDFILENQFIIQISCLCILAEQAFNTAITDTGELQGVLGGKGSLHCSAAILLWGSTTFYYCHLIAEQSLFLDKQIWAVLANDNLLWWVM